MVLESLVNPFYAEKKPWQLAFIGFLYSSIAIFLGLWIFEEYSSLIMVFLTVFACAPFMYHTIKLEEKKDLEYESESTLLREHSRAIACFMLLFFGISISYTLWYVVMPADVITTLFSVQSQTITNINNQVTGNTMYQVNLLVKIFLNNVKVLIFCILFAFIYGLGAIFILVWNGSVIGAAAGNFIRSRLGEYASDIGLVKVGGYLKIVSMSILRYAIHGTPEILAYFVGGLAGGIISVAVIKHDFGTREFERIILDSSDLVIIALVILVFAALLEVFVTPVFF